MKRRTLLALASSAVLLGGCGLRATAESGTGQPTDGPGAITITDVLGRTVTLDALPERVLLGEQRQSYALFFLQKEDPTAKVVAWSTDMQKAAPDMWTKLLDVAPHAADIPTIGSFNKGDVTLETVLSHDPEVVVVNLDSYEAAEPSGIFARMDEVGLPYVVTDYRIKPVENTRTSVRALGTLFDRSAEANAFLKHYDTIVDPITKASDATADADRPLVFHWRSPGISEPGRTYGDSNFGQITGASGGENLGTRLLDGDEGTLSVEQLIKAQPDLIIASGGEWAHQEIDAASHTSYVHLGYDATPEQARASLAALRKETGHDQLRAFDEGKVFGIYHQFYNAPFNFIVFQAFAAWQGLDGFTDTDIAAAWKSFHDEFMPWDATGTVAIGIRA